MGTYDAAVTELIKFLYLKQLISEDFQNSFSFYICRLILLFGHLRCKIFKRKKWTEDKNKTVKGVVIEQKYPKNI